MTNHAALASSRADLPLPYAIAADPHWLTAGSTRVGLYSVPDRRSTQTDPSTPLNLDVYDLGQSYTGVLEAFAREHTPDGQIPTGRTALMDFAAGITKDDPDAARELAVARKAADLEAALLTGQGREVLGGLRCPRCQCWSLLGERVGGRWRAECSEVMCAFTPDPSDADEDADPPTGSKPRTWSLRKVAHHHLAFAQAA